MRTAIDASPVPTVQRPVGSTDADLIAAVRGGDDAAFATLYGRYHRRITAYVLGMVKDHGRAEDITQEVFLSALRRMRATDAPIIFKPWVYEIAKNACIDQFRRASRAEEVSYDAEDGLAPTDHGRLVGTGPTPDAAVDQKLSLDHLCSAFGGLSQTHHDILVMRELEGLSYREIGERLGMTRPAVESTLFRARRKLSEEYDDLVTGRRCLRVQSIIASAATGALGARDRRRMAIHVSHCQPCRRHARFAGIAPDLLQAPRTVRARVAALLPLPAFLRRGGSGGETSGGSTPATTAAQWSAHLSALGDPAVAGWAKAVAAAATVAVAGLGAGAAVQQHDRSGAEHPQAAAHHVAGHARDAVARTARVAAGIRAPSAAPALQAAPSTAASLRPRRSATSTTTTGRAATDGGGRRTTAAPVTAATDALPHTPRVDAVTKPVRPHRKLVRRTVTKAVSTVGGLIAHGDGRPTDAVAGQVAGTISDATQSVTGIVTGG